MTNGLLSLRLMDYLLETTGGVYVKEDSEGPFGLSRKECHEGLVISATGPDWDREAGVPFICLSGGRCESLAKNTVSFFSQELNCLSLRVNCLPLLRAQTWASH